MLTVLCALAPIPARATPKAAEPPLPIQIKAAVEPLLLDARKTISAAYARVESVKKKSSELAGISKALQEKERASSLSFEQSNKEHGAALTALYGAKVSGLTTTAILNLNTKLAEQVQAFREQVLNSTSPNFISGNTPSGRRGAMSQIILSEKEYVGQVATLLKSTSAWMANLKSELQNLSNQGDDRSLQFGFGHYLTISQLRLEARRSQLMKVSAFFNGKNIEGATQQPKFECSSGTSAPFRSFSGDLEVVEQWAATPRTYTSTDPNAFPWVRVMNEGALLAYDGDNKTGQAGYTKTWASCVNSKSNNMQILTADINRALQRGEKELAINLDLQRAQLDFEKTVLEAQASVVAHRRLQLGLILKSTALQATADSLISHPDAWRKTIQAHSKNLNDVAVTFPGLLSAAVALLDEAQKEMSALSGLQNWKEIQSRLALTASNIEIIRKDGLERFISQLESAEESLGVMGSGIADAEILLTEALSIYEAASRAKVDFLARESTRAPQLITAAQARVESALQTLSNARASVATSLNNSKLFQESRDELDNSMRLFYATFGMSRLNPIYTKLVNELLQQASGNRAVIREKAKVEQHLKQTLTSFSGISMIPEPAATCRSDDSTCKKTKSIKIKAASAKALLKTQRAVAGDIPNLVTSLSREVAGISLSELVAKIENTYSVISSLK